MIQYIITLTGSDRTGIVSDISNILQMEVEILKKAVWQNFQVILL